MTSPSEGRHRCHVWTCAGLLVGPWHVIDALAIVTLIMTYTSSARAWRRNWRREGAPPTDDVVL